MQAKHLTMTELEAGLPAVLISPADNGVLEMIVRRPQVEEREVLESGMLDLARGLQGDNWKARGSKRTADGSAPPDRQITLMNSRVLDLVAGDRSRWPLAGDQLIVDLDLSIDTLPVGTRLAIGDAVIEITEPPHTGCKKFAQRFGADAVRFLNSESGLRLRLRGAHARVETAGAIRVGDTIQRAAG